MTANIDNCFLLAKYLARKVLRFVFFANFVRKIVLSISIQTHYKDYYENRKVA